MYYFELQTIHVSLVSNPSCTDLRVQHYLILPLPWRSFVPTIYLSGNLPSSATNRFYESMEISSLEAHMFYTSNALKIFFVTSSRKAIKQRKTGSASLWCSVSY